MVIIASWMIGTDISAISAITRIPKEKVQEYGDRLRDNGLWKADHCVTDYSSLGDNSGIELALDGFVARGLLNRTVKNGESAYVMNDIGAAYVKRTILPKLSDDTKARLDKISRKKGGKQ